MTFCPPPIFHVTFLLVKAGRTTCHLFQAITDCSGVLRSTSPHLPSLGEQRTLLLVARTAGSGPRSLFSQIYSVWKHRSQKCKYTLPSARPAVCEPVSGWGWIPCDRSWAQLAWGKFSISTQKGKDAWRNSVHLARGGIGHSEVLKITLPGTGS